MDYCGFYSDEPSSSVYGPLTPIPLGTEEDTVFRPRGSTLGLGAQPEDKGNESIPTHSE